VHTEIGRARAALMIAALLSLCGCYASNVVAREDRSVDIDLGDLQWSTEPASLKPGLYESVELRGDVATTVWKIYYLFEDSGRYTAAALIAGDDGLEFRTLAGTWEARDGGLVLDGRPAVPIRHAPDHVLLDTPQGSVVLRSVALR